MTIIFFNVSQKMSTLNQNRVCSLHRKYCISIVTLNITSTKGKCLLVVDKLKGSESCCTTILGMFLNFSSRMEGFRFFCITPCSKISKSSYGKTTCIVNAKSRCGDIM